MPDNNNEKKSVLLVKLADLRKLSQYYFEACTANADYANNSITHLQNGLLTIILAELAFVGITDLSKENPSILGIIASGLLVISAFLFIFGVHSQWRHVLRASRNYLRLSKDTNEFINKTGIDKIETLPDFLSDKNNEIKTDNWANGSFILSISGVFSASVLIFIHLLVLLK